MSLEFHVSINVRYTIVVLIWIIITMVLSHSSMIPSKFPSVEVTSAVQPQVTSHADGIVAWFFLSLVEDPPIAKTLQNETYDSDSRLFMVHAVLVTWESLHIVRASATLLGLPKPCMLLESSQRTSWPFESVVVALILIIKTMANLLLIHFLSSLDSPFIVLLRCSLLILMLRIIIHPSNSSSKSLLFVSRRNSRFKGHRWTYVSDITSR